MTIPADSASPSAGPETSSGQGSGGACHAPIVACFHGLYWGFRVGPIETIFPCGHPPHLRLGNGAMRMSDATMRFTQTLMVRTKGKLAAIICKGGIHTLIYRHINCPMQAKTRRHLQVVRRPRVLGNCLFRAACIFFTVGAGTYRVAADVATDRWLAGGGGVGAKDPDKATFSGRKFPVANAGHIWSNSGQRTLWCLSNA